MNLSISDALLWTQRIAGIAVFFQTLELILIPKSFSPQGIWNWKTLKRDFAGLPRPLPALFGLLLDEKGFIALLWARLLCSVAILHWSHPLLFFVLALSTLLICARWRGTFNGGSDAITQAVLNALLIASLGAALWPESTKIAQGALIYIAVQSTISYVTAGIVKIKVSEWRSGRALCLFLQHPSYDIPQIVKKLSDWPRVCWILSWLVMSFECLFPWALFNQTACVLLIGMAFGFHLVNVYVFGLNRFLFAWSATYPAILYFCSNSIRST